MSTRNNLSRRAVLAGVAAVPATTAVAGAVAHDTELLALGAQLDPIIEQWLAQHAADRIDQRKIEAKVKQVTGIAFSDAPGMPERPWPLDTTSQYRVPGPPTA